MEKVETLGPRIKYNCVFGPHLTESDAQILGNHLQHSDIVILEVVNWDSETLDEYNKVSLGIIRPEEASVRSAYPQHERELLRILYNSNKVIVFPDIPNSDWSEAKKARAVVQQIRDRAMVALWDGQFDDGLREFASCEKLAVELNRKREEKIASNIVSQCTQASRKKELATKEEINVLISYGSIHQNLSALLGEQVGEVNVTKKVDSVRSVMDDVRDKLSTGRQIEPIQYANSMVEMYLTYILCTDSSPLFRSTQRIFAGVKRILSDLAVEDFRELSSRIGRQIGNLNKLSVLISFLEEKNAFDEEPEIYNRLKSYVE